VSLITHCCTKLQACAEKESAGRLGEGVFTMRVSSSNGAAMTTSTPHPHPHPQKKKNSEHNENEMHRL